MPFHMEWARALRAMYGTCRPARVDRVHARENSSPTLQPEPLALDRPSLSVVAATATTENPETFTIQPQQRAPIHTEGRSRSIYFYTKKPDRPADALAKIYECINFINKDRRRDAIRPDFTPKQTRLEIRIFPPCIARASGQMRRFTRGRLTNK